MRGYLYSFSFFLVFSSALFTQSIAQYYTKADTDVFSLILGPFGALVILLIIVKWVASRFDKLMKKNEELYEELLKEARKQNTPNSTDN